MANNVGSLVVSLGLDAAQYTAGLSKAEYEAKQRMDRIQKVASQAVAAIGALGVGTAFVQSIQRASEYATQVERLSKVANASIGDFQGMAYAAKTVGIEQDKLADILKDVNDKVGDFLITGGGPLKDFFEQIAPKVGVTADQFRNLSGPQALQLYVSSLQKANVSQAEMTFFMEAIASDATLLLPLLQDNGKAMADLSAEAKNLGKVLDEDAIRAAKDFDKNITQIRANLDAMQIEIGNYIIPSLNQFIKEVKIGSKEMGGFWQAVSLGFTNPFNTSAESAAKLRKEIAGLEDDRQRYVRANSDTTAIDQAIAQAQKKLNYFNAMAREAMTFDPNDQSGAEARRLGLLTPTAGTFRATSQPPKPTKPIKTGSTASRAEKDEMMDFLAPRLRAMDEMERKAAQMYAATLTPLEQLAAKEAEIFELRQRGYINDETYFRARAAANDEYETSLDTVKEKTEEAVDFAKQLGLTFSSAFEDAIAGGKDLRGVLDGIASDIAKIIIRKNITTPLANAVGSFDFSSLFSFAGGGYTGDGARSGGLDGQGGYLAMLHPQETVVDHASGQGMGTTVSQNITIDARGADAGVTERIMQAMRQTKAETLAAVQAQANRGGSFARAVGRA